MMNDSTINNGLRFFFLAVLQIFLLKQISWGFGGKEYLFIFLYPLFIMMLPIQMIRHLVVLAGFAIGFTVDLFYETLGINAAAATLSAFLRPLALRASSPREGYNIKHHPTVNDLGWSWYFRYAAWFLGIHLLLFFSIQAFTFYFWTDILLKTFFSFVASYALMALLVLIFNPKN
ncbi:hypothetical protein CEQ90_03040 [Lewinellaceae bacterium SD302]|nr:hypothetical protein CEQ90_03040 [Lewinellaceae bacterium SD302]